MSPLPQPPAPTASVDFALDLSPLEVPDRDGYNSSPDVTLEEGTRHLVRSMSNWLIPRLSDNHEAVDLSAVGGLADAPAHAQLGADARNASIPAPSGGHAQQPGRRLTARRASSSSMLGGTTFASTEHTLRREMKRQYLAVAIACWFFLTVVQSVSLITLNYWEYSPVVIGLIVMTGSILVYWRYIFRVLQLPSKRLWETPYPYALSATVLGSLAQHAIFLVSESYNLGELLIVFFLIQAFYIILVASTFRNYIHKWQKFLNHRKLCHDALSQSRRRQVAFKRSAAMHQV